MLYRVKRTCVVLDLGGRYRKKVGLSIIYTPGIERMAHRAQLQESICGAISLEHDPFRFAHFLQHLESASQVSITQALHPKIFKDSGCYHTT